MNDEIDAETAELGRLFVEVTGEKTVQDAQDADADASHLATDSFERYKERHDATARHADLQDALSDPEVR